MNEYLIRQLSYSLKTKKNLPEELKIQLTSRLEELKNGFCVTVDDLLKASSILDLPFTDLMRRAVLGTDSVSSFSSLSKTLENGSLDQAVFIASACIIRINDTFYFTKPTGKADLDHPVPEALLEKTRQLFLANDLPMIARAISSPISFYTVGKLAENDTVSPETLAAYLYGAANPFFDKTNTAFFNALSEEEDKRFLLRWLIRKYQALENAEIEMPFDDKTGVFVKTADSEGTTFLSAVCLEDNLDFLETDLPEKAELLHAMDRIKKKAFL